MSAAEPLTPEEMLKVERTFADIARTQPPASASLAIFLFELADRLLATVRAREAETQALRDAIFAGHAGYSCKQIGESLDRALEREAKLCLERDDAARYRDAAVQQLADARAILGAGVDETLADAARRVATEADARAKILLLVRRELGAGEREATSAAVYRVAAELQSLRAIVEIDKADKH